MKGKIILLAIILLSLSFINADEIALIEGKEDQSGLPDFSEGFKGEIPEIANFAEAIFEEADNLEENELLDGVYVFSYHKEDVEFQDLEDEEFTIKEYTVRNESDGDNPGYWVETNGKLKYDQETEYSIFYVFMLWDSDKSMIPLIEGMATAIKNEDPSSLLGAILSINDAITGDEIISFWSIVIWESEIEYSLDLDNDWHLSMNPDDALSNDDISEGFDGSKADNSSLNWINDDIDDVTGEKISGLEHHWNWTRIDKMEDQTGNFSLTHLDFSYVQMNLKKLQIEIDTQEFSKGEEGNPIKDLDFEFCLTTHKLIGLFLYDDENDNDYMDLKFEESENEDDETWIDPNSTEMQWVFGLTEAELDDDGIEEPEVDDDSIVWSVELKNLQGTLFPFGNDAWEAYNKDYNLPNVDVNISEFKWEYKFTPEIENNELTGTTKFDTTIGEWAINTNETTNGSSPYLTDEQIDDLSLSVMYFSSISDFDIEYDNKDKNTEIEDQEEAESSEEPDDEEGTEIEEDLEYEIGGESILEIDLIGEDYEWYSENGTEENDVTATMIPIVQLDYSYGEENEKKESLNINIQSEIYIYSVNYPKWAGNKIVHDPVYTVHASIQDEASIPILAIITFSMVLIIAILAVIIHIKKRD